MILKGLNFVLDCPFDNSMTVGLMMSSHLAKGRSWNFHSWKLYKYNFKVGIILLCLRQDEG